jgi:hypothetical protein
MGRHAELKGHSAARVGLTPILAPDPTACKWPNPELPDRQIGQIPDGRVLAGHRPLASRSDFMATTTADAPDHDDNELLQCGR